MISLNQTRLHVQTRKIIWLLLLGAGLYLLFSRLGELDRIMQAWKGAEPIWLAIGLGGSILTYLMAALQQQGATQQRIPYGRNVVAHVAATFADQFGPRGIGGIVVSEQFLEGIGFRRRQAIGSVALKVVTGAGIHFVGLVLAVYLVGRHRLLNEALIEAVRQRWVWFAILGAVIVALLLLLLVRRSSELLDLLLEAKKSMQEMRATLWNPVRVVQLLTGSTGVTASYIVTLYASMVAIGVDVPILTVAAVYLAGELIGSASPTPGGLGMLEGAFVAGFAAFGTPVDHSIAGVLLYRLFTLWLPSLLGVVALHWLQDRGYL